MDDDAVPWFDPPPWWKDGMIDGLTWEELLAREWQTALNEPPSPRELEAQEWARKLGAAAAQTHQEDILRVVTEPNSE